jgi:hypothetical protein
MHLDQYQAMTPGQRNAKRGTTTPRPWHKDFRDAALTDICNYVAANPWIQSRLGPAIDMRVMHNGETGEVMFCFKSAK